MFSFHAFVNYVTPCFDFVCALRNFYCYTNMLLTLISTPPCCNVRAFVLSHLLDGLYVLLNLMLLRLFELL